MGERGREGRSLYYLCWCVNDCTEAEASLRERGGGREGESLLVSITCAGV